ncbi:MAG: superinfection immunity protein [Pseudomonadota bacterium]
MDVLIALVVVVLAASIYFLPAIVAHKGRHRNKTAITVINLFFGWTLLGWVLALVMAVWK